MTGWFAWLFVALAWGQADRVERKELQWACDDANPVACFRLARTLRQGTPAFPADPGAADRAARRACLGGHREACALRAGWRSVDLAASGELGRWLLIESLRWACRAGDRDGCDREEEVRAQLAYDGPPVHVPRVHQAWDGVATQTIGHALGTMWNGCVKKDRAWQTRIIATVTVGSSGRVQGVTFAEGSTKNVELETCIARHLLGVGFPASPLEQRHARAFIDFGKLRPNVWVETPREPTASTVPVGGTIPASLSPTDHPLGACRHGSMEACDDLVKQVRDAWWSFDLDRRAAWVLANTACEAGASTACSLRDRAVVDDTVPRQVEPFVEFPVVDGTRFGHPMMCRARIAVDARGRPREVELFACGAPHARVLRRAYKQARWVPQEVGGVPMEFWTVMTTLVRPTGP